MGNIVLLFFVFFISFSLHVKGQKTIATEKTNLTILPVRHSVLTGLELPPRTKKGFREDSMVIVKNLLQQHALPYKSKVGSVEILYVSGDSIANRLTKAGWVITQDPDDKRFFWITRGNRSFITYHVRAETDGHLYFGELDKPPKMRNPRSLQ
jgi:hypothetical protein